MLSNNFTKITILMGFNHISIQICTYDTYDVHEKSVIPYIFFTVFVTFFFKFIIKAKICSIINLKRCCMNVFKFLTDAIYYFL